MSSSTGSVSNVWKTVTSFCDMEEYFNSITAIDVPRNRRKQSNLLCTQDERKQLLPLTGSLNWIGHAVLPQASFEASYLQQMISNLTVECLVTANKVLHELKQLKPIATMKRPSSFEDPSYLEFSDASQAKSSYGQTGYISGLYLPAGGVFHAIDWYSSKQRRLSFSAIGADILAAATSADRSSMLAERFQVIFGSPTPLLFVLTVESNGLFSTITTLHECFDYRLRPTVSRLRYSYEGREITVMQWTRGPSSIADALTKRNLSTYRKLNDVLVNGTITPFLLDNTKRVMFTNKV